MKRFIFLCCTDLLLLLTAFGLVHQLHYGHLNISDTNYSVLRWHLLVWLSVALLTGKYTRVADLDPADGTGLLLKTGVATLFLLSLIIVSLHLTRFSRTMVYGTVLVLVFLEVLLFLIYKWSTGKLRFERILRLQFSGPKPVFRSLIILDGLLLVATFFVVTYFKRDSLALTSPYDDILLLLLGLWLGGSLMTQKFQRHNFDDFFNAFGPAIKTTLFMAAGLAFSLYLLRIGPVSRLQTFAALPVFLFLEALVFLVYVNYQRHGNVNGDIEDPQEVQALLQAEPEQAELAPVPECSIDEPAADKLKYALEFFDPRIFEFINTHINLQAVDRCKVFTTK